MSTGQIILLLLVVLGASAYALRAWSKRQRRKRLLASELSDAQRALIEKSVPLTRRLPPELRRKLDGKIARFLDQIRFIGCNGLEVTEEMRLSIAAQACLLVVNTDT